MAERPRTSNLYSKGIITRHVRIFGQNDDLAEVDPESKALISIDITHTRIHQGRFYSTNHLDLTLANNGSITFLVRIANKMDAHARPFGICGGDAQLDLFEGPTVTDDGTPHGYDQ